MADPGKEDSLVDGVQQDEPGQLTKVHPGYQLLIDLANPRYVVTTCCRVFYEVKVMDIFFTFVLLPLN